MPRGALTAVAGGAAVAAALPWLLDDFLVSLALSCLMYVALASSWAMFSGATRYVSLGTSAFFGLGAYVSAWTVAAAPWPVVIAGGALIAAVAGAAGAAMAVRWTYIDPTAVFNPFIGLQTVLIAIVGGPLSLTGPLLAALVFSLLAEFLRLQFPYAYLIALGILLIVAVLYLPQGLAGLWQTRARAERPTAAR